MRKVFFFFLLALIIFSIFYKFRGGESKRNAPNTTDEKTASPLISQSKKRKTNLSSKIQKKSRSVREDRDTSESNKAKILNLIEEIVGVTEKCNKDMNDLFGPEDNVVNFALYTEFEILEYLDRFTEINFNAASTTDLLTLISNDNSELDQSDMSKVGAIRPCRIFQKINFLDEIKKRLDDSNNSKFKDQLRLGIFKFIEKEINSSNSIATLTLTLNMLESFSGKDSLDLGQKKQKEIELLMDQLEEEYESMLVEAEDEIYDGDNSMSLSKDLIKNEISLNRKYKSKLINLIKDE